MKTITTEKGKFSTTSPHIVKLQFKSFVKNNSKRIGVEYLRTSAEIVSDI